MDYRSILEKLLSLGGRESKNVEDYRQYPPIGWGVEGIDTPRLIYDPTQKKYRSETEMLIELYNSRHKK